MRSWVGLSWPTLLFIIVMIGDAERSANALACEQLPTDGSPLSYRFWADAPRCEGTFVSPVAGEAGMSLVSLTIGRVLYDLNADRNLELRFADQPDRNTRIQAVGLPLRLYYRLDADIPPGQAVLRLPLGDVVGPRQIGPQAFGVYGVRVLPDHRVGYIPVQARPPGAPPPAGILIVVRPGSDVTNVAWRIYAPGGAIPQWVPIPEAAGLVPEGRRIEIDVGAALPAVQTTFEVSFYSQGVPRTDRFVLLAR
jgi:hypothetical protein